MEKDFDTWNAEKKRIDVNEQHKLYHEREIWWCSLGVNVGYEQDGTGVEAQRPVLILKGLSAQTCYAVPLSTSTKKHKYRVSVGMVDGKLAVALLSQIRVVDTKRLVNKVGFLDQPAFDKIKKAARGLL